MSDVVSVEETKNFMEELGDTGLTRFDGRVFEEFLKNLKGRRGIKTFREMADNDAIIGGALTLIDMLMNNVDWRVEPASESPQHKLDAEFVQENMDDMESPWKDTISEILTMLRDGFAVHEEVYKMRTGPSTDPSANSRFTDGRFGWRKFASRSQDTIDRWEFAENGDIIGVWQMAPPSFKIVFIPADKFLLFRTTNRKNNPEGRSILRNAFRSWFLKKKMENIEAIGVERDLAGLPVALVPPNILDATASPQEKALLEAIKKIIVNIRRDEQEGLIFPLAYDDAGNQLYKIELMSTAGSRQFDTSKIIQRYNMSILVSLLADFILLGHDKVGSFALVDAKTSTFSLALSTWMKKIANQFNRHAIPRLFQLNNMPIDELPKIVPGDIETADLKALGDFVKQLAAAGMELFPDDKLENFLRQQAGMPLKDEEVS